jgi:hypothetical protein
VSDNNVIDLFTRQPIEPPDDGFEDADHYCEWVRQESSSDVIVIGEALQQAQTVKEVEAGLTALRRQINSMKPPKSYGGNLGT